MSGIVGIYYLDGRTVERSEIQMMSDRIIHRGPDGSGIWIDGSVGLGHRMLRTTPESLTEKLPLTNQRADLAITVDARIDNREELISALNLNGRPYETISDSEIILAAYEKWGEKCPEKLLGDFSFAIWDKRREIVFCAGDHFGVKPFYYHHSPNILAFASEIKGILHLSDVPRRLNEVAIGYFLARTVEDKTITFYDGIMRLPPAHTMTVDDGKISINPYWSLDPTRRVKLGSNGEYAEAFRDLFKEAVRCRLRSAFPVGSMLSGGLDSSSIVCTARQLLSQDGGNNLHTFSAIFNDIPECDEQAYINTVIAQGGIQSHFLRADKISPLACLDDMFRHQEEAFLGTNMFMYWGLYNDAKTHGIRVLLDGDDGDTTVSHGLAFLPELFYRGRWKLLTTEVKELSRRLNIPYRKILWGRAIKPLVPEGIRRVWRILRGRNRPSWTLNRIINPNFTKRIGLEDRIQNLQAEWVKPLRTEQEDHWRGLSSGIIPSTFEMVDRAATAFHIEPRYPFFDKRLAEFCLALPPEQKLHNGWTRMVLRRAMTNILPAEIQWRSTKSDLSPNFKRNLLAFERERLEEIIKNDSKIIEPYVDLHVLRKAFQRYVAKGKKDDALSAWMAVTLGLWILHTGLTSSTQERMNSAEKGK